MVRGNPGTERGVAAVMPSRWWLALAGSLLACTPREPEPTPRSEVAAAPSCPTTPQVAAQVPDVTPDMRSAAFWLTGHTDVDAPLVGAAERERLATRLAATSGAWRDPSDPALADPTHVQTELDERLAWLRERVASGKYVEGEAEALEQAALIVGAATPVPEAEALRPIVEETPLWCVPTQAGLYTPPAAGTSATIDRDFDRNQCASLHLGELVRVLRHTDAWAYVDAGHSVGWIALHEASPLGLARTREALLTERAQPHGYVLDDWAPPELEGVALRAGTRFLLRDDRLVVPRASGERLVAFGEADPVARGPLVPTRRRVLEQAFVQLDDPYGWGGRAGQRDCSSLMLDVFAQFEIPLGRNSAVQSQLGVETIELAGASEADKRAAIRDANARGVVLLYMPGHIMLYLGHHALAGVEHDYAISAISEFLTPCPGGPDTVHRLDRVTVSTLELGRGTARRAYLERIERLAVFAPLE